MQDGPQLPRRRLADLVHVGQESTSLECPECGRLVCEESEAPCALHEGVEAAARGEMAEARDKLRLALEKLTWLFPMDKTTLLEVVTAVRGLSITHQVTREEVLLGMNRNRVPYSASSLEVFGLWLRDKFRRAFEKEEPPIRFLIAMRIRKAWQMSLDEARGLKRSMLDASNDAIDALAERKELERTFDSLEKAISGLSQSDRPGCAEKCAAKRVLRGETMKQIASFDRTKRFPIDAKILTENRWNTYAQESGILSAEQLLIDYNRELELLRAGSLGNEGRQFEHECWHAVQKVFPNQLILKSVTLPKVSLPRRATAEFDFWVVDVETDEVMEIIEVKRSAGELRSNVLKKKASIDYLRSDKFNGIIYSGLHLTRDSFRRFEGDGFFQHMWFIARQPIRISNEDVFGVCLDNEDIFLTCLREVALDDCSNDLDNGILSDSFIREAFALVSSRFTERNEAKFQEGLDAFLCSIDQGRVFLLAPLLKPAEFRLPRRHKSTLNEEMRNKLRH